MKLAHAVLGSLCLSLASPTVSAMTLSSRGTGQVLLFPYYTVNAHQQTLISIVNTTARGKGLKLRFREGYNGREVLDFNIFLAPYDVWTSLVFSLDDAGLPGAGAAIAVGDTSCTAPSFPALTTKLPDGRPYKAFLPYTYTGAYADTGPADDTRTREGNFEVFEMAEITGDSLTAITHLNGIPADCSKVQEVTTTIPDTDLAPPTGGLAGSAAIIDGEQGTIYAFTATAIDGFRDQPYYTVSGSDHPDLADGAVSATGMVTAYVPIGGQMVPLHYPADQSVDAVSALLAAAQISGDWDISPGTGVQTDWVITFPTKHFYTDPLLVGDQAQAGDSLPPFPNLFGMPTKGRSDVLAVYELFDREGGFLNGPTGIDPPPPPITADPLGYETQVGAFRSIPGNAVSQVLGSHLISNFPAVTYTPGVVSLIFSDVPNGPLRPSVDGYAMQGLPVIAFEAINYVNANATPGVLANYSATYPVRATAACQSHGTSDASGACPTPP